MRLLHISVLTLAISCYGFGQTYTIETIAGGVLPGHVAGTSASLGPVNAVAADQAGNIYFSAANYSVVLRLDAATGLVTIVAGNGISGYSGDNGPATSAQLGYATGLAVDNIGNLFILDQVRVREVSGGTITTVAGSAMFGDSGDGGPAIGAEWRQPDGIAVDAAGNIYIADTGNNRIRKISRGIITTVAGTGTAGYAGDGGLATNAEVNQPTGVAVDSAGNLYIADQGNGRVRKVSGGVISTVAGNGVFGFSGDGGPATLANLSVYQVTVDAAGNLYISDEWNRVREVSNGVITTVAGNGTQGFSGDGGTGSSAELNGPSGVAVDSSGSLYIADQQNGRVRRVAAGVIQTVAGGGGVGDGGAAISAQLDSPRGIALDASGKVYIADAGSYRVRMISGGAIFTAAGSGIAGNSGNNVPPRTADLSGPEGIAIDPAGEIYLLDGSSIREVTGGLITTVPTSYGFGTCSNSALIVPSGIAVDASHNLYVANTYGDCVLEIASTVVSTVAGTWFNPGYSGDSGPAVRAQVNAPQGVAVNAAGDLYIADSSNNVIRKVSKGIITTVAGNGIYGFSGDNGPATSAQLFEPIGVALDAAGNLYIADNQNDRIRKVSGGVITTIAGSGAHGYSGDNGPAAGAALDGPSGIAVDAAGNVYFSDTGSNRVRKLIASGLSTCTYSVSLISFAVTSGPSNFNATVQTPAGCTWAVDGLPSWISVSGDAVSSGPGTFSLTLPANTGNERTAYITVAGSSIEVTQAGILSINHGGVVNAANYYKAPVAPGSIAAVFGDFPLTDPVTNSSVPLATLLPLPGGEWDFYLPFPIGNAPLFFGSAHQVNIQIPWELAGQTSTTLAFFTMPTNTGGIPQRVELADFAPGIFSTNAQGSGQGTVLDTNYRLVDASNPAAGGSFVQIYCTGLGVVANQPATGAPASLTDLSSTPTLPVVTIGGVQAYVSFSGLAPGFVGLYQVNAQVPAGLAANSAAPVALSMGGVASNTVTIAIE